MTTVLTFLQAIVCVLLRVMACQALLAEAGLSLHHSAAEVPQAFSAEQQQYWQCFLWSPHFSWHYSRIMKL
jgi:hypothetical protein